MKARFQDMQDSRNPKNGSWISDVASFAALLSSFKGREPFCFLLTGENGFTLTVSWSPQVGSVQFSSYSGEPPYLMAVAREAMNEGEFLEFLVGGTPTPVDGRFCLSLDRVREIVQDFLAQGGMSHSVEWEEV